MQRFQGFHGSSILVKNPKKKVLSNRQLTKRVRSLTGQEGNRIMSSALLYSAVALVAGTPDINYFDDFGLYAVGSDIIQHYFDCHIKLLCTTAGGCTVRLLYGFDEDYDGTNLTGAEILNTATDSASGYLTGAVANYKEAKHKNARVNYRTRIVWDKLIPLIQNEPKSFNVRLPMYNRKTKVATGANIAEFYPFMLALSDEADSTISVGVEYWRTNLEE